jgi:penicillin amidase
MAIKSSGQGRFIMDGTKSSQLYTGYIPEDSLPQTINPSCNYVLSANQHPTYPGFKYYYNGYYSETRANRIRQVLENGKELDINAMEALQLDNTNSFAVDALPVLTKELDRSALTEAQQQSLKDLEAWKGRYDLDDKNAELFELWWKNVKNFTWDEFSVFSFKYKLPEDYVLLDLIRTDPSNAIFDKQGTTVKENAENIVQEAFDAAYTTYDNMKKNGSVRWGDLNKINITHPTDIKAFGATDIPSAGHPEAPNAISANWGPSWRMVVELGERPKAYGVYPGGESGHIGSAYYDDFIKDWNKGVYYPLTFFISLDEARTHATGTWSLK